MPISNRDELLDPVFVMGIHVDDDVFWQGDVSGVGARDPRVDDPDVVDVHLGDIRLWEVSGAEPYSDPRSNEIQRSVRGF